MIHPGVEELLSQFTPEELASILREELDAVGIPYTCNPNDEFKFVPISIADLDIPYESAVETEMKTGKFTIPATSVKTQTIYDRISKIGSVVTVHSYITNNYHPTPDYPFAA